MAATRRSLHPVGVVDWLVTSPGARVLDLAHGSAVFARQLQREGRRVVVLDRDAGRWRVVGVAEPGQDGPTAVVGQPESLPFRARSFDVVTASDTLQHFAPGLALPEVARVLRPEGSLSVVQTTRDDTVPWVRRLAALVQQVDPEAMRGDYGQQAIDAIEQSGAFTELSRRDFRNWIPITRDGLVEMVAQRAPVQALAEDRRAELLTEVAELFHSIARYPEPLMLPFQSSCWRAHPVPGAPTDGDDVLQFSL